MIVSRTRLSTSKEKYNEFFWDFVALAFLCIPTRTMTENIKLLWNIIETMVMLWTIIVSIKTKVYNVRKLLPIWIWFLWFLFSTIINSTGYLYAIKLFLEIYSIMIFTYRLLKIDDKLFMKSISVFFLLEVFIQILTYFSNIINTYGSSFLSNLFRYNHNWNYLFGIRVNFNQIFIFSVIFTLINSIIQKTAISKNTFYITLGNGLFFIIAVELSTGKTTIIVFLAAMIFFQFFSKIKPHKLMMYGALAFSLIFNFSIGAFKDYFTFFFVDFLHESENFAGRPALWASALSQIKGVHWVIGNGYKHNYIFTNNPLSIFAFTADTAHSDYVNVLFCFGIIGLVLYLNIIRNGIEMVSKFNDGVIKNILTSGIIAISILEICFSIYNTKFIFIFYIYVLFLSYNTMSISKKEQSCDEY